MMDKRFLSWHDIEDLVVRLLDDLPRDYDVLLAIARGGMVPCCLISEQIDIRNILVAAVMHYTGVGQTIERPLFLQFPDDILLADKHVLVVDDVWDSGKTIMAVKERLEAVGCRHEVATLHYKPQRSHFPVRPDYYAEETDEWIVYPWDPQHERVE
jgi:hypoxanthine phosphoribosyltransferase